MHNSGTHNNEWIVTDYTQFKPGSPLPDGTIWMVDQMVMHLEAYASQGTWTEARPAETALTCFFFFFFFFFFLGFLGAGGRQGRHDAARPRQALHCQLQRPLLSQGWRSRGDAGKNPGLLVAPAPGLTLCGTIVAPIWQIFNVSGYAQHGFNYTTDARSQIFNRDHVKVSPGLWRRTVFFWFCGCLAPCACFAAVIFLFSSHSRPCLLP